MESSGTSSASPSQDSKETPSRSLTAPTLIQQKSASPNIGNWVEQHQGEALAFAFALVLCYMAPIYLVAYSAVASEMFSEENSALDWFSAFVKSSDSTLNQFHKLLLPFMAALSVASFRNAPKKAMFALAFFILLSFTCTVCVSVIFDMSRVQIALTGLPNSPDPNLAKAFFSRIQETLLMYLMMLLGIGLTNKSK